MEVPHGKVAEFWLVPETGPPQSLGLVDMEGVFSMLFARLAPSDIRGLTMIPREGRSILYAATAWHGVFRSDDAGATWRRLPPLQSEKFADVLFPSGDPACLLLAS